VLSVSRSPARSFKKAKLCHQFGLRSAHGFDHEAPCPRQPARASPAVRRAKGHGSVFRANHGEAPSDEIGRRALWPLRFQRPISGGKRFATCQFPFDELELAAVASGHTGQGIPMDA